MPFIHFFVCAPPYLALYSLLIFGAFDESVANPSRVLPGRAAEYDTDPDDGTRPESPLAPFAYNGITVLGSDIVNYRRSSGGWHQGVFQLLGALYYDYLVDACSIHELHTSAAENRSGP